VSHIRHHISKQRAALGYWLTQQAKKNGILADAVSWCKH